MNMDVFEARKNLVDVLIKVVGETLTYAEVLSDLKFLLGAETVAKFGGGNSMPMMQWVRLVTQLSELEAGLSPLTRVLEPYLSDKSEWRTFVSAAEVYCIRIADARSNDGKLSTTLGHERLIQCDQLLSQLRFLSSTFHDVSPEQLERCLDLAISTRHPNMPRSQVYSLLFAQGPINSWDILLDRMTQLHQYFDEKLLSILKNNLSVVKDVSPHNDDPIGSLVIMLLSPLNKTDSDRYSFRAYYCGANAASVDEWVKVFDPANDIQIRHSAWRQDLQALLPGLLCEARAMRATMHEKLMLEIFLPTELIDAEIHTLKLSLLSDSEEENVGYKYPIVARSAWGYQTFVERKHEATSDSPLISRWRHSTKIMQSGEKRCRWWHDTVVTPDDEQEQARIDSQHYFNELRAFPEYFGMKRLETSTLGSCYEKWKEKLMDASPAIALWWRPDSTSQLEHRERILQSSTEESDFNPTDNSQYEPVNPQSDPFANPDVSDPLKLSFALASAVYRGQFDKGGCGQAFREMVLLVDSHDRWPPPLDRSPVSRCLDTRSGSVEVDADEMLMSG
jgi:hypothetical protein